MTVKCFTCGLNEFHCQCSDAVKERIWEGEPLVFKKAAEELEKQCEIYLNQIAELKFDLKEITGGLKDKILELEAQLKEARAEVERWESFYELLESHAEYAHTWFWDEHPEDYNDPCLCATCRSYMTDDA